ncbi:MAG: hypothetical protein AMXMBFR84_34920 [Candidatus Hydrogenedentota bacterium]
MKLWPLHNLKLSPLFITILYAVFASLWILSGDFLLATLISDKDLLTFMQFLKGGVLFVGLTALMLYFLIRKHAIQIRTSQRLFEQMMNNLPGMAYRCHFNQTRQMDFASPGALAVTGYSADEFINRRIDFDDIVLPEYKPEVRNTAVEAIRGGKAYAITYQIRRKDGMVRWVWEQGSGVPGEDGALDMLEGYIVDVTETREAHKAVEAQEAYFRSLIENAPDIILAIDPDGRIRFGSPSVTRILGYEIDSLTRQNVLEIVEPVDRPLATAFITSLITMPLVTKVIEIRLQHKDRSWRNVEVIGEVANADEGPWIVLNCRDITERLRTETEMTLLAHAVEQSADSIMIMQMNGLVQYVNQAFVAMTGYERDEIVGKPFQQLFAGDAAKADFDKIWNALNQGEPWAGVTTCQKKSGQFFRMEGNVVPIKSGHSKTSHMVAIHRDVTEQEFMLSRTHQSQKLEAIGTLAGGIAHDFNNILSAVMGYTEVMLHDVSPDSPLGKDLTAVYTAGQRARSLVRQILTFSRDVPHELQPVDLGVVIREALLLLRAALPSTIAIEEELDEVCCLVNADSTQIHQVIMNLCTNAAHAMRERGGTLAVKLQQRYIDSETAETFVDLQEGVYAYVQVCDTGHGMDRLTLDRVFEPFFTTKKDEGTGLGLSTVHGIVKSHKGAISVHSELGKGTVFGVFLPGLDSTASVQRRTEVASQNPAVAHEHVLFVDDEESLMILGKKVLERMGYRVTAVNSGAEALEKFSFEPKAFDIIVTDQAMPGLQGLSLAEKAKAIRPDVPVIITTGYSDQTTEQKAANIGVYMVLMKPLISNDLASAIRSALDRKNVEVVRKAP